MGNAFESVMVVLHWQHADGVAAGSPCHQVDSEGRSQAVADILSVNPDEPLPVTGNVGLPTSPPWERS